MADETKVTETPKVSEEAPLIENPRAKVEEAIIAVNDTPTPVEETTEETPKVEVKEAETKEELSEVDRIKQSVQKRINAVVAQKKSAEERLAEAEAEIARLKSATPANTLTQKDALADPTPEQVEAYILKMREEGNAKEEIAATRYLISLEKNLAIKAVKDEQVRASEEARNKAERENQALLDLAKDYIVYDEKGQVDMKNDLTLANQKGKLFETAMALYNDPELHKLYYNDPDRAMGLRRAVQDANRELHAQGLIKTPKDSGLVTERVRRQALADPSSVEVEETSIQSNSPILSDADKVRAEIAQRAKLRNSRTPAR